MQPLGEAVDEQIDHLELGQIGLANASYSAHSRCVISLTAVPLNGDRPRSSANSASISRVDSPRASSSSLRAADDLVKPGAKGHRAITDLRRSVFDHALRPSFLSATREYGLSSGRGPPSVSYFRKALDELRKIGFVLQGRQLEIVLKLYSTKKTESRSVAPRASCELSVGCPSGSDRGS